MRTPSDDPSGYRPKEAGEAWPLGDPIERLKRHLVKLDQWDEDKEAALLEEMNTTVRAAQKEAEKLGVLSDQGDEGKETMFEDVYADMPWHIAEQRDAALKEGE